MWQRLHLLKWCCFMTCMDWKGLTCQCPSIENLAAVDSCHLLSAWSSEATCSCKRSVLSSIQHAKDMRQPPASVGSPNEDADGKADTVRQEDMSPSDRAQRQYAGTASLLLFCFSLCCFCHPAAAGQLPTGEVVTPPSINHVMLAATPFTTVQLCAPFNTLISPGDYGVTVVAEPQVKRPASCTCSGSQWSAMTQWSTRSAASYHWHRVVAAENERGQNCCL